MAAKAEVATLCQAARTVTVPGPRHQLVTLDAPTDGVPPGPGNYTVQDIPAEPVIFRLYCSEPEPQHSGDHHAADVTWRD